MKKNIEIYTKEEINILKEGGNILYKILQELKEKVKEGENSFFINEYAIELCEKYKAKPAFLHYRPEGAKRKFPSALCLSLNEEVVHGIANEKEKIFKKGDVVVLDMGILYKNYYTDSAITVIVGGEKENKIAYHMIKAGEYALEKAISFVKSGVKTGDIGHVIEFSVKEYCQKEKINNFSIPHELGGHGIGRAIHENPFIPNFGKKGQGVTLTEGMVIAIEPILTEKKSELKLMKDDYTYVTKDKGLSIHVEHTIVVTKDGCEIITI